MRRTVKYRLRGSTLAETLVMMIVTGILFLCIMDGMTIFTRMQIRRTVELLATGRATDGYYRVESLVSNADSAAECGSGLLLYRRDTSAQLRLQDSALIYEFGDFRDTLIRNVETLSLSKGNPADTVEIGIREQGSRFRIRFPERAGPPKAYTTAQEQIEQTYGYEE